MEFPIPTEFYTRAYEAAIEAPVPLSPHAITALKRFVESGDADALRGTSFQHIANLFAGSPVYREQLQNALGDCGLTPEIVEASRSAAELAIVAVRRWEPSWSPRRVPDPAAGAPRRSVAEVLATPNPRPVMFRFVDINLGSNAS
jgi:hypothetical protein